MIARVRRIARLLAGPLVLVGYFLPWAEGPGVLSVEKYSGFELVGVADRLQALDLGLTSAAALLGVRLLIVGVAIAAAWLTVLAVIAPWHRAHALSGWYIVATAGAAIAIGVWRGGAETPPAGLALWAAGAVLFVAAETRRIRPAQPRPKGAHEPAALPADV